MIAVILHQIPHLIFHLISIRLEDSGKEIK